MLGYPDWDYVSPKNLRDDQYRMSYNNDGLNTELFKLCLGILFAKKLIAVEPFFSLLRIVIYYAKNPL